MNDALENPKVKVDFRTFTILLVLAAVPILAGTWWMFSSHEEVMLEAAGSQLSNMAETAFSSVNGYLQNQIIAVAGLTEVDVLRDAVAKGNLDLKGNLFEVRKSIPKLEAAWRSADRSAAVVRPILENSASGFLRRYVAIDKQYRDIIVTDFLGRLVAATSKSASYYWAHEPWWKETYGDGFRGSVYIGDARFDEQAKTYIMDVAQPFVDPEVGVTGIIRATMDLQGINSLIGSIEMGPGGMVALIHARGDVISAPGFSSLRQNVYPWTLDILNARDKSKTFFISTNPAGAVFGLTQRSFQKIYPNLNWIVVGNEQVRGVLGPIHQLRTYVLALFAAIIAAVIIAALMLSRGEYRPVIEEDPHLEKL
jgi:hypothetical protein